MNEKIIWDFLYKKIKNPYGVAGLMGNLYAESALNPKNLQQSYEKTLGYTDDSYTKAVDNKTYCNFIYDKAGYGLAQWTYYTRKERLLKYANSQKSSIGDLNMQLNFLWKELTGNYQKVVDGLYKATSVRQASDIVLLKYEQPKDQSITVQVRRAEYGQKFYNQFVTQEAQKPMKWYEKSGEWKEAQKIGLTDGTRPEDTAKRAEVAAMILRGIKYILKKIEENNN